MTRAQPFVLDAGGMGGNSRRYILHVWPNDNHHPIRRQFSNGGDYVLNQWAAGKRMHHFRVFRFHSSAASGGEYNARGFSIGHTCIAVIKVTPPFCFAPAAPP
jgi:hypothetical protein